MPKVKVKTILQTVDDINKNKRRYSRRIMEKGLQEIMNDIKLRQLVGELDHPVLTGNDDSDCARHFLVLYERTSHIITNVYFDGNNLMGDVETTLTDRGFTMAGLLLDGVPVGFSLRAVGDHKTINGIDEVCDPFFIITWDCVSNPSHASARVINVMTESKKIRSAANVIREGCLVMNDRLNVINDFAVNNKESRLQNLVEQVGKSIHEKDSKKTNALSNKLLEASVRFNSEDSTIWDFIDDIEFDNVPKPQAFKKHFG
jgi:hypothetical protein